jgi:hypothetical protein
MIEQNKIKPGYNKERYFTFKMPPGKAKKRNRRRKKFTAELG